jgi:hypothetical protein
MLPNQILGSGDFPRAGSADDPAEMFYCAAQWIC